MTRGCKDVWYVCMYGVRDTYFSQYLSALWGRRRGRGGDDDDDDEYLYGGGGAGSDCGCGCDRMDITDEKRRLRDDGKRSLYIHAPFTLGPYKL